MFDWLVTIWLRLPRTLRGNLRVGAHFGKVAAGRLWQFYVFTFALGLILGRLPRAVCGNFTYLFNLSTRQSQFG